VSASPVPALKAVALATVALGEPLDFGRTRDGLRRFTPIIGGELRGIPCTAAGEALRGLRAEILPGGGDRQLVRSDGAVEIDARYDARTEDGGGGALIGLHATGLRRASADGVYFRVTLRFETADSALAELQDSLFIADGVREADRVRHTVYRVC